MAKSRFFGHKQNANMHRTDTDIQWDKQAKVKICACNRETHTQIEIECRKMFEIERTAQI